MYSTTFVHLLSILSLASLLCCDLATSHRFIFPGSEPSVLQLFDLIVNINDSMIVEYAQRLQTTAIGVNISCYDTVQNAVEIENYVVLWPASDSCERR
jgi:hypothetical protein